MSLAELKANILALPENERHELLVWLHGQETGYGDTPGERPDDLAAEIWDEDDLKEAALTKLYQTWIDEAWPCPASRQKSIAKSPSTRPSPRAEAQAMNVSTG